MPFNVVRKDNFDREIVDEYFILNIAVSEEAAYEIAEVMNKYYSGDQSSAFFKAVPKEYKLFKRDY
jgi:hypothetical protein